MSVNRSREEGEKERQTNLGVVEALNVTKGGDVLGGDEVDGDTLASETTTATNPVDVVLPGRGEVVVDDEGDLPAREEGRR
jgi:hypothetical protein